MRKKLLTVALLAGMLLVGVAAKAQPKALGVRFGWVAEVSYQHALGPGFLEFGLGVPGYTMALALDGTYNWIAYRNTSSKANRFEFFLGAGLGLHTFFYRNEVYVVRDIYGERYVQSESRPTVGLGLLGSIGVQYQFSIPLQIGVSWRPMLGGLFGGGGSTFYTPGLFDAGVSFRYVF